jgi:hypothetical protein
MKREDWEFIKYAFKVNLKHFPRLFVAPIVGVFREPWRAFKRMDAEIDEFDAKYKQRIANGAEVGTYDRSSREAT